MFAIDVTTGQLTPVLSDLNGFEIDMAGFNFERTVLAVGTNEDGYRTLHLRDAKTFASLPKPKMDRGLVGNIRFIQTHSRSASGPRAIGGCGAAHRRKPHHVGEDALLHL